MDIQGRCQRQCKGDQRRRNVPPPLRARGFANDAQAGEHERQLARAAQQPQQVERRQQRQQQHPPQERRLITSSRSSGEHLGWCQ